MAAHISESVLLIKNIINYLFPYRGIKLLDDQDVKAETIILKMLNDHYYRLIGVRNNARGKRNLVYIYLLDNDPAKVGINLPVKNKPDFAKLMKIVLDDPKMNVIDEVIFVAPEIFFQKKAIISYFKEIITANASETYDEAGNLPYFTASRSDLFSFDLPNHAAVYKHELMTKEDVTTMMVRERISYDSLPMIMYDDPQNVWLGGRPGQIIRIYRPSEITGMCVTYRRIMPLKL
jgi:DNA-directed RNA polymerase subunit H (RpoH/RPB5)